MSKAKDKRQNAVLDVIKKFNIGTQEDLTDKLIEAGYKATQATVSRDIKDLGLIKISVDGKTYRYSAPQTKSAPEEKIKKLFKEAVLSVTPSLNLVVIKTLAGSANTAAYFVDTLINPYVLGTIAGDDTIIIAMEGIEHTQEFTDTLNGYLI